MAQYRRLLYNRDVYKPTVSSSSTSRLIHLHLVLYSKIVFDSTLSKVVPIEYDVAHPMCYDSSK